MSKKLAVYSIILILFGFAGVTFAQQPMNNFCMQPPFVSRVLKPDVMVLMDTSGSMRYRADVNAFNSTKSYFGYFDPTQWYVYNTAAATPRFEIAVPKSGNAKLPEYWDGNFMNWAAMRRMDIVKKVLVGGRTAGRTGPTYELLGEWIDCNYGTAPFGSTGSAGQCQIPTNSSTPIANVYSYIDQRATDSATLTYNGNNFFQNGLGGGPTNFSCAASINTASSATLNYTLTAGSGENITTCVQVRLRQPGGTFSVIKAFGAANPGNPINIAGSYTGPGTYALEVNETNNPVGTCGTGTVSVTGVSMTVVGTLATTSSSTLTLLGGTPTTTSQVQVQRACGNTNFNIRVLTNTEPTGVIQTADPDIRFGLEFYSTNNTNLSPTQQGGYVVQPILDNLKTTGLRCVNTAGTVVTTGGYISCIEQLSPNGNTPLGESIWSAIGYYARTATVDSTNGPLYASGTSGSYPTNCDTDPFNFTATGSTATTCPNAVMVPCAKAYVLAVTDGEPTSDNNVPASVTNVSTTYADGISGNEPCSVSGSPTSSNCAIDNVTLYGHADPTNRKYRDLRNDLTGDQYVTDYLVLAAFGSSGGGVLDVAARNGGFIDSNSNGIPDLTSEFDTDGVTGADNYFNAQDGQALQDALTAALNDILKRTGSATANSVIGAGKGQGSNILQAFFFPLKDVGTNNLTWVGFLHNLWFQVDPLLGFADIREDTVQDQILDTLADGSTGDDIATFLFDPIQGDASVRRFLDTNGDGLADSTVTPDISLLELKPIWEAGISLFNRTSNSRIIYTTVDGSTRIDFCGDTGGCNAGAGTNNRTSFFSPPTTNLLQATSVADANNIIDFVRGTDITGQRPRTTTINISGTNVTNTWKLGDIIDSTAQIQGPVPLNDYHLSTVYSDSTYRQYISSTAYQNKNFAYAGANDGMFHAFFVGKLNTVSDPSFPHRIASITDPSSKGLGKEQWAYVPRNALPYLRYLMDKNYCHLYYVNNPPVLFDASISDPSVSAAAYPDTPKLDDNGTPGDPTDDTLSWRTIVIGSMGLGGGCGCSGAGCTTSPLAGSNEGLSSYFALDVTDPANPVLLWEFSNPNLGFALAAPGIVKISALDTNGNPDKSKNGHWYVVIGSGPTGDIETISHQFRGKSVQTLKYFVLDLKDGTLLRTITPQIGGSDITHAFSGSLAGVVDSDKDYQDEVVYGGFVREGNTAGLWNVGGVLRIETHQDSNVNNWTVSTLVADTPTTDTPPPNSNVKFGPVPTKIAAIVSDIGTQKSMYLYFGSGRYYFKDSSGNIDDADSQRRLFGVKEKCYDPNMQRLKDTCSSSDTLVFTDLFNATTDSFSGDATATTYHGFFINLDVPASSSALDKAERVITNPDVSSLGVVFFTTFAPSADPCTFGGKTFIWALRFDTGAAGAGFLYGFALVQTSTGEIEQQQLSNAFTEKATTSETTMGRRTAAFLGQPPREGALTILTPPPFKTILRVKER